jgi:hypothetical protein
MEPGVTLDDLMNAWVKIGWRSSRHHHAQFESPPRFRELNLAGIREMLYSGNDPYGPCFPPHPRSCIAGSAS